MGGPMPLSSPARWAALALLADTGASLTATELAERLGLPRTSVRDILVRPRRAGWVSTVLAPSDGEFKGRPLYYQITDTGRRALAERTEESDV